MGHGIKFGIAAAGTLFLLTILSWSREPTAPGVASADTGTPTTVVSATTEAPTAVEAVANSISQEVASAIPSVAELDAQTNPNVNPRTNPTSTANNGESEIGCILTEPEAQAAAAARLPNPGANPRATWKKHSVKEAETLISIARQYLQDGSRWKDILQANPRLRGPEYLRTGMTLLIPNSSGARSPSAPPAQASPVLALAPSPSTSASGPKTYKVVSNDTLSKIALKTLGAKKHWRKIFDANQDRLASPDDLRVGQELRIPRS